MIAPPEKDVFRSTIPISGRYGNLVADFVSSGGLTLALGAWFMVWPRCCIPFFCPISSPNACSVFRPSIARPLCLATRRVAGRNSCREACWACRSALRGLSDSHCVSSFSAACSWARYRFVDSLCECNCNATLSPRTERLRSSPWLIPVVVFGSVLLSRLLIIFLAASFPIYRQQ